MTDNGPAYPSIARRALASATSAPGPTGPRPTEGQSAMPVLACMLPIGGAKESS